MNYLAVKSNLVEQLRRFMGTRNAVIGESGGIDSALVTFLCVEALGSDRVIARTMPYGNQSTDDADAVARAVNLKNYGCINIKSTVDTLGFTQRMTIGNAKARVRMINLYALAAENNGLVIGTSNKTEMMLGYFTKYGDGGCDIELIADLFKTEVQGMAKSYRDFGYRFPETIISKAPSAELWDGQTDEGEIGMTYAEMDKILSDIKKNRFLDRSDPKVDKINKMYLNTEHKRRMPPTFYV